MAGTHVYKKKGHCENAVPFVLRLGLALMRLVWMMTDVSAFCQYSLLVVIVRVTLHDLLSPVHPEIISVLP